MIFIAAATLFSVVVGSWTLLNILEVLEDSHNTLMEIQELLEEQEMTTIFEDYEEKEPKP